MKKLFDKLNEVSSIYYHKTTAIFLGVLHTTKSRKSYKSTWKFYPVNNFGISY